MTEREKEVLLYAARGYSNKELAALLNISFHTVKSHFESINIKLNTKNKIQSIFLAYKTGLIDITQI